MTPSDVTGLDRKERALDVVEYLGHLLAERAEDPAAGEERTRLVAKGGGVLDGFAQERWRQRSPGKSTL